jgi:hypothetical protein
MKEVKNLPSPALGHSNLFPCIAGPPTLIHLFIFKFAADIPDLTMTFQINKKHINWLLLFPNLRRSFNIEQKMLRQ